MMGLAGPVRVVRQAQPSTPQPAPGGAVRVRGESAEESSSSVLERSTGAASAPSGPKDRLSSSLSQGGSLAGPPSMTWEAALREADCGVWDRRTRAFEDLARRIRAEAAEASPVVLGKALSLALKAAADAHPRVAQAALEALVELTTHRPDVAVAMLDQLLPRLLGKLGDGKEHTRALAKAALDRCREAFDPAALCASLVRVLHEQQEKPKLAALELLRVVVPSAQAHLSHGPAARALMQRLAAVLTGRPSPPMQRAAQACALAHYHLDPTVFTDQFVALSADAQAALRRAVASQVPDLDARVVAGAAGRHHGTGHGHTAQQQQQQQQQQQGKGRTPVASRTRPEHEPREVNTPG
jgi:hypothetical protein